MVNPGGPSKGCKTCIKRKIKCDQQRPVCGQCRKSNRECGGYRNSTDLIFRDESQNVIAKGLATSQSDATTPEMIELPANLASANTTVAKHVTWINSNNQIAASTLRLNEESGLMAFFTNNFTCGFSNKGTNLFWMPRNLDDLLKEAPARFSVQSVGAMALARLRRSAYHHREAQRNYGLALLSLKDSLQQHQLEEVKDAVLITILFLGFFEVLASYDGSSRRSWTTHLRGLGVLLNQRGEGFLKGDFGAKMLKQSRSQSIMNALQTRTPVPEAFRDLANRLPRSMPPNLVASDDADVLLIRVATLQAQYHMSGHSNPLFSELIAVDSGLCQWMEHLSPLWYYSTHSCENSSELWWAARCDVYSLPIIANVWNKVRAARIVVHDIIQEMSLRPSSPQGNDNFTFSLQQTNLEVPSPKTQDLVTDICATIPVFYRPSTVSFRSDVTEDRPPLGTVYWLLWPLEVIGSMREASLHLTDWARQVLERIYNTTGIAKAQIAAQRVQLRHSAALVA